MYFIVKQKKNNFNIVLRTSEVSEDFFFVEAIARKVSEQRATRCFKVNRAIKQIRYFTLNE